MKGSQSDASTATTFSVDKLSYEIFSILESKFLSGIPTKNLLQRPAAGRVRILSIDTGGATNGLLAAASITRLESSLQRLTSDPSARISDFFDVAAGAGTGGVLAALLFVSGAGGRPLFSAAEASRLLLALLHTRTPLLSRIFLYRKDGKFLNKSLLGRIFGELTLRDTVKPLLITCFDMRTRAPFLFSRAAALENQEFNFLLSDVCAATTGAAAEIMSVDRKTVVEALAGGVAVENPAAAAMTHVVNNRTEFPLTTEVEDLFVVSLGNGELTSPTSPSGLAGIVGQITADMVSDYLSLSLSRYIYIYLYIYIFYPCAMHLS